MAFLIILLLILRQLSSNQAHLAASLVQRQFQNVQIVDINPLTTFSVASLLRCAQACSSNKICSAFTFEKSASRNKLCNLYETEAQDDDLIPNKNYDYYEMNGCYDNNPCLNGGTCLKVVNSTQGQMCQCPTQYDGNKCQNTVGTTFIPLSETTASKTTSIDIPTTTSIEIPATTSTEIPTTTSIEILTTTSTEIPTITEISSTTSTEIPTTTSTKILTTTSTKIPTTTSTEIPTTTSTEIPTTTSTEIPTITEISSTTSTEIPTTTTTEVPTTTSTEIPTITEISSTTRTEIPTATTTEVPTTTTKTTEVPTTTTKTTEVPTTTTTTTVVPTTTSATTTTPSTTISQSSCNNQIPVLKGTPGNFTSDNYPAAYGVNLNCTWIIDTTTFGQLNVTFNNVDLENTANCTGDKLLLFNGPNIFGNRLAMKCGTSSSAASFITNANKAVVQFLTDSHDDPTHLGFKVTYYVVAMG